MATATCYILLAWEVEDSSGKEKMLTEGNLALWLLILTFDMLKVPQALLRG